MPITDLERFCRALVRDMPDAVIYADKEGRIAFWNGGAERIFGFTEAEAKGQSLDIIIPENLRARHWQGFEATMQTGKSRYGAGDTLAGRHCARIRAACRSSSRCCRSTTSAAGSPGSRRCCAT